MKQTSWGVTVGLKRPRRQPGALSPAWSSAITTPSPRVLGNRTTRALDTWVSSAERWWQGAQLQGRAEAGMIPLDNRLPLVRNPTPL